MQQIDARKMRELRAYLPKASKGEFMDSSGGLKSDFCISRRVPIKGTYQIVLDRQNKHKRFGNQVFLSIFPTNNKWCFFFGFLFLFADVFCN